MTIRCEKALLRDGEYTLRYWLDDTVTIKCDALPTGSTMPELDILLHSVIALTIEQWANSTPAKRREILVYTLAGLIGENPNEDVLRYTHG